MTENLSILNWANSVWDSSYMADLDYKKPLILSGKDVFWIENDNCPAENDPKSDKYLPSALKSTSIWFEILQAGANLSTS